MGSEAAFDRRTFFRDLLHHLLAPTKSLEEENSSSDVGEENRTALWGDLPRELMHMEAERLGIDPERREDIFRALQKEMLVQKK
jgi:hypothetical protein